MVPTLPALVDAHIDAQQRLRKRAADVMGAAWLALASYDERDVPVFLATAVPTTRAAQAASVALTNAYLARRLRRRPAAVDVSGLLDGLRAGVPAQEVYRRPFVTVWSALKAGRAFEDAVHAGLERVTASAEMDVQLASRATFGAVQQADPSVRGYERVPDAGACEFCLAVAGAFVRSADAMPLHNRCGCSLEPVFGEVHVSPTPAAVAVHEHGELGAVLADPAHSFTSL